MIVMSLPDHDRRALAIYGIISLGFVLSIFYRVSATIISPQLSRDLGLDTSQLADLSAAFFYAFALTQIPLGVALDRWGPRKVMIPVSILGLSGTALFALAQGPGMAMLGRVLLGIGMSCQLMGALTLIGSWFSPWRFATLSSLMVAVGQSGQLLAATPLALLVDFLGWRGGFLVVGALHTVQVFILWRVVLDRPAGAPAPEPALGNPLAGLGRLIRRPAYWGISWGSFLRYGVFMALQGLWLGPFLLEGLGRGVVEAGNLLVVMGVGYMIALPLMGRLSDAWLRTRKWVIAPAFFFMAGLVAALGMLEPDTSPLIMYGLFFFLGASAAPGQIMYPHIKELMPPRLTSTAMTGINLFTMLGPAAVMQASGWMVDSSPGHLTRPEAFWPIWLFMAGGLVTAGLVYLFIPESGLFGKRKNGEGKG